MDMFEKSKDSISLPPNDLFLKGLPKDTVSKKKKKLICDREK